MVYRLPTYVTLLACLFVAAAMRPHDGTNDRRDAAAELEPSNLVRTTTTEPTASATTTHNRFGRLLSKVWRHGTAFERDDLEPVPANNPHPEPQPSRDRPGHLALAGDETKLYVALTGTEHEPGHQIAIVDIASRRVTRRIEVGSRPYALALHPNRRFLMVTNELSNYASVIDTVSDRVVSEIAVDYYCQGIAFAPDGRRAYVANRYLDQVLVVDLEASDTRLDGHVHVVGGFDEEAFFGTAVPDAVDDELTARHIDADGDPKRRLGGIEAILRSRCGHCHGTPAGGFVSGPDPQANFFSAIEHAVPGDPDRSPLLRAVVPTAAGGYGDQRRTPTYHAGQVAFRGDEPELARLRDWIAAADDGPGIRVGNDGAHPKDVVLSRDGKTLFVGNTGTMDVAIVDTTSLRQVGAIFVGNVASALALVRDAAATPHDQLLVLTMGAGFGTPKARDPHVAETWDRDHPHAQFSVLRDPTTTDPWPLARQAVLGPFDAVDGTWNSRMRDIQNDIVAVDLARLDVPARKREERLSYQIMAHEYEAHASWVRYTSDTAEATSGDLKGDLPPELMRVPGSFFEAAAVSGDRVFATMAGSFELVEWQVDPHAADPANRLEPVRVLATGLRPIGVAASRRELFVANSLSETVSVFDRATGERQDIVVGNLERPALDTDAEKGELIAHTTVFSSDNDTSCLHCHYRDTGDGRGWGAAETIGQQRDGTFTHGGTLGIPQMRNVYAIQPYYFEGTHRLSEGQGADITEPASSVDFDRPIWAGDFTSVDSPVPVSDRWARHEEFKERLGTHKLGSRGYTLDERRDQFFRQQSLRYFQAAYGATDLFRFMAAWLGSNNHLLPNPYDREHPSVRRGEQVFHDPLVMCSVCHTAPEFTNKSEALTHNDTRSLPPLTTVTRRDASYTLASVRAVERANKAEHVDLGPSDDGRVEPREGGFTTMQLRGIFDRPPAFLHHGRARSLREAIATPSHPGLRRSRLPIYMGLELVRHDGLEVGFNETTRRRADGRLQLDDQVFDTHGGTSHLSARQLDDLVNFMLSIP